jgi:hypothetical protein
MTKINQNAVPQNINDIRPERNTTMWDLTSEKHRIFSGMLPTYLEKSDKSFMVF